MVNSKQKYLLIIVAIILTIMILFPPFQLIGGEGVKVSNGFHFILLSDDPAVVNVGLLFVGWLFVVSIAVCCWFIFKENSNS